MKTYQVDYNLFNETISKNIEASNVAEAKKIAATPDMLPNSFINNYEDMEVVVRTEDGIPVGVMDYNDIKSFK